MRHIVIALCCNNPDNGNFSGKLNGVDVGPADFLSLESHVIGAEPAMHANAKTLWVSRRRFEITGYQSWYGNWCWDAVCMSPVEAARFVNYLRSLKYHDTPKFSVDVGRVDLFDKWNRGAAFTPEDFKEIAR